MEEAIGVYTPARVSREVYESVLKQLDAQLGTMEVDDALVSRDYRHAWFRMHTKEEDPYGLLDESDEDVKRAAHLLGAPPQTRIDIGTNDEEGTINILIDFVLLFAAHYPCAVIDTFGSMFTPEEFATTCAKPGFDGYRWDATHTAVVKGPPETPEEKSERLAQMRRKKVIPPGILGGRLLFALYTPAKIGPEEFRLVMQEIGAVVLNHPHWALLTKDGHEVQFRLEQEQEAQQTWEGKTEEYKKELERALGGPPQSIIRINASEPETTINLALDFMFAFEKRYPCIVWDRGGELHKPEELLEFAKPGYDGYRWDAKHNRIVKDGLVMGEKRDKGNDMPGQK